VEATAVQLERLLAGTGADFENACIRGKERTILSISATLIASRCSRDHTTDAFHPVEQGERAV
jgi:hypothetical protein